ncbi:hypothetical protein EPUS_07576 [Endocarpon pusillum Z07020]|uniref:Uncharacterized protein n=1 Tax=Endocarpon pusillum (strain Z07020 / HMAS-L-300199) TaxID=1263415 RepID=U1HHV9_ENDPU|nr:uncharacterized protein EPUS_07576 [Endocarpon pusillum Z07020]ERF69750.1 hypothetical protein EPUS_07576 [Endocarpon pusillum Z07020]
MKGAQVSDPESHACVTRCGIDHDKRFAFAAPENSWVVEPGDVRKCGPGSLASLSGSGRYGDYSRWGRAAQTSCCSEYGQVIRGAVFFSWSAALASVTGVAGVGFAEEALLVKAFGDDTTNEQVLVRRPRREGDDCGIECLLIAGFVAGRQLRDALDDVWQPDVICVRVWLASALQ